MSGGRGFSMRRWLAVLCLAGAFAAVPSAAEADLHARFASGGAPGTLRAAGDEPATLHVKALDARGEPFANGLVQLIRVDRFMTQELRLDAAGEATVEVGDGTYAFFALIYTPERAGDRETVTYTSLPEVAVAGDAGVVLDARGGRPVRPPAVRDAVRIDEGAFIYSRGDGGQWFNTGIFPSAREIERGQVRIKPTGPAATGTYGMLGRWRLYGRGPHGDLFDLALASPRLEPEQRVEPGSLARLDATYRPLAGPATYTEYRTAEHPLVPGGTPIHPLTTEHDLRVPTARREWVSAGPDVRWGQCLRIPVADQPLLRLCEGPRRAYAAGSRERHDRMLMPRPALGQVLRSGSSLLAWVGIGEGEATGDPIDRGAASRLAALPRGRADRRHGGGGQLVPGPARRRALHRRERAGLGRRPVPRHAPDDDALDRIDPRSGARHRGAALARGGRVAAARHARPRAGVPAAADRPAAALRLDPLPGARAAGAGRGPALVLDRRRRAVDAGPGRGARRRPSARRSPSAISAPRTRSRCGSTRRTRSGTGSSRRCCRRSPSRARRVGGRARHPHPEGGLTTRSRTCSTARSRGSSSSGRWKPVNVPRPR